MQVDVTIYYLEMTAREEFRPRYATDRAGLTLREIDPPDWEWNRRMYALVGESFHWVDRLAWSPERWREYAHHPALQTVILEADGRPAGYFEIDRQAVPSVELAYFGLAREFIGQGLGAHLLSAAIEEAWRGATQRVWVHTCTLDHRHALRNYQQRGFRIFRSTTRVVDVDRIPEDCLHRAASVAAQE